MTNNTYTSPPPTTWWGKQWLERLEKHTEPTRIQRAHKYLRADIVTIQEFGPDVITGQIAVQQLPPRHCSMSVSRLSEEAVHLLIQQLTNRPGFAYQLANREIPPELDQVMAAYGEHLVPTPNDAIISQCECPDAAPPCTHCAAIYIMAGQRFEQNPLLLLKSRGVDVDAVNQIISESTHEIQKWSAPEPETASEADQPHNDGATPQHFWADDNSALMAISIPPASEPTLIAEPIHRLGQFPNWQSELPFLQTMEAIYRTNAEYISNAIYVATKPLDSVSHLPANTDTNNPPK